MTAQLSRERIDSLSQRLNKFIVENEIPLSDELGKIVDDVFDLSGMLLAGMDSEPVAYIIQDAQARGRGRPGFLRFDVAISDEDINEYEISVTPLYAAPPAPVAAPEHIRREVHAGGNTWVQCSSQAYERAKSEGKITRELYEHPAPVAAPDALEQFALFMAEEAIKSGEDNNGWRGKASNAAHEYAQACRDAMQSEPVTAATVPDGLASSVKCWCRTCRPVSMTDMRFVVCSECGNKRCPRANDHRNACTGSNEAGQEGSAYPAAPEQEV